jgi:hypothetical protein
MSSLIVWDIETVPDLKGFAAANGHLGSGDDEVRVAMGQGQSFTRARPPFSTSSRRAAIRNRTLLI